MQSAYRERSDIKDVFDDRTGTIMLISLVLLLDRRGKAEGDEINYGHGRQAFVLSKLCIFVCEIYDKTK